MTLIERIPRISNSPPKTRGRGFTLLEIVIGLFVLAVLALTFTQLIRSSGTQTILSSQTFAANQVASKVMSDLSEETRINTMFLELLRDMPEMGNRDQVVDSQSAYFRHLKDLAPPYGRIDPELDGGIRSGDGSIYQRMRPFFVRVQAERRGEASTPGFERHVAEVEVNVDWKEKDGMGRSYVLQTWLPSPSGPKVVSPFQVLDEATLPQKVRERFFPEKGGTDLRTAVQSAGGNYDLILELGRIEIGTDNLASAVSALRKEIGPLETRRRLLLANPSPGLSQVQLKIARRQEIGASLLFMGLSSLVPSLRKIDQGYSVSAVGALQRSRFTPGLSRFALCFDQIPEWVLKGAEDYSWLLEEGWRDIRPNRLADLARSKALDAYRLLFAIDSGKRAVYEAFITKERDRTEGRNPFWEKTFLREPEFARNPSKLTSQFPNLKRIAGTILGELAEGARIARKISSGNSF